MGAALIVLSCLLSVRASVTPAFAQTDLNREQDVMSSMGIVGYDPQTGEVGVAAASRVFAQFLSPRKSRFRWCCSYSRDSLARA